MSGIANMILDKHEKDKNSNLNDLLPNMSIILVHSANNECADNICTHNQSHV